MPTFLQRILKRKAGHVPPERIYAEIVAQARRPWPYARLGVPDTIDGRFDMLILHAFLVFRRLKAGDERAHAFSQDVFDAMFRSLDHTLREMGVGDMAVGKRIRKMAEIFYGRSHAYEAALSAEADRAGALAEAIRRNIFAGEAPPGAAEALARHAVRQFDHLAGQETEAILEGNLTFDESEEGPPCP